MNGTILGLIAIGLVVLSLLIWMNVAMVKGRSKSSEPTVGVQAAPEAAPIKPNPDIEGQRTTSVNPVPIAPRIDESMEVVSDRGTVPGRKVFDRPDFPFVVKGTTVPMFREDRWLRCFQGLTQDRRVLGWIAFSGETLGASDREYESGFVDVVRTYLRTLDKLRREVGLEQIRETSIVADEGNVWFLAASDDAWFALFVESGTDVHELTQGLLRNVVEGEPHGL